MALTKTGLTFVNGQAPALNGANMNVIVDLTDDIVDAIETPSYSDEVEETKEIISLNGNARGGTFDATVKGNTWSNSLTNGNFASGTVGWSSIAASSMTVSNKVMSLTGDGTSVSIHASIHTTIPYTTGRKVFTYTRQRVTNSNCTQLALTIANTIGGGGVAVKNITPTINTYYEMYAITTLPSDSTTIRLYLRHSYTDTATANGKVMEVDGNVGVFAIDMTALGLESKTEAEMLDIVRAGYWEGTKSTDKSRILSVGKNLFDGRIIDGSFYDVNDGVTIGINSTRSRSEGYTTVESDTEYRFQVSDITPSAWYVYYYDSAKNFISRTNEIENLPFTTPSNCKYIRWSVITGGGNLNEKGIKVWITKGSTATTYEPFTKTQATCPVELHSVPVIQDEWETNTGKITKNVQEYVLQSGDIDLLATTRTNFDIVRTVLDFDTNKLINAKLFTNNNDGNLLLSNFTLTTYAIFDTDVATNVGNIATNSNGALYIAVPKGTYANLAAAQSALAGTVIYYQLATPETIYTQPAILNAEPNGTVYVEPYIAEDETAQFYSSGLVLDSNYPLSSLNDIDEINKYNLVDGTITPVDISDLTLASSTLITSVSATDGEFYALSYNYKNLSTIGTVKHNHGLNIKAQANDATEGLKLLDKKINDTKINIEQLNDKIEDLYINQIYGTRW